MGLDDINGMINRSMGLSAILEGTNRINSIINKSIGFSKTITSMDLMIEATNKRKDYLGIGSINWISKNSTLQSMGLPNNIFNLSKKFRMGAAYELSRRIEESTAATVMTKRLSGTLSNATNTFVGSSLNNILGSQYGMLNQLSNLKSLGTITAHLEHSRNIFNTLGSLSARIATVGLASSLINESYPYIEEVTNEAAEITNTVVQQEYATTADIDRLFFLVNSLNNKLNSINKPEFRTFGFWLCILSIFIGVYPIVQQKIDGANPDTTPATKQQIIDFKSEIIKSYNDNINFYSPIRITQRECNLFLKPTLKSYKLMSVLPNKKLSVINTKGKWVLVTCLDKDSLPVTGWILKKYLGKSTPIVKFHK